MISEVEEILPTKAKGDYTKRRKASVISGDGVSNHARPFLVVPEIRLAGKKKGSKSFLLPFENSFEV